MQNARVLSVQVQDYAAMPMYRMEDMTKHVMIMWDARQEIVHVTDLAAVYQSNAQIVVRYAAIR